MRALVTGGAGFIGSNLVDALVARGEDVLVLDDLSSGRRENLTGALDAGATLLEASIADRDALARAFDEHRPQAVFHLAAQIDVRRSVEDPLFDLDLNVGGTINLLERSRAAGVERFVFASTGGAIYGEGEGLELPLTEDAACRPDAPYGQSKFAAEGYLSLYRRQHSVPATALRLGNVYGPRQDPHGEAGVVSIFGGRMLRGEDITVFGDGTQTRDYVFVHDVVDAFVRSIDAGDDVRCNIGTGEQTSVNELYAAIAGLAGHDAPPSYAPARPGELAHIALDVRRAAAELGWAPRTSLHDGLAATLEWLRSSGS